MKRLMFLFVLLLTLQIYGNTQSRFFDRTDDIITVPDHADFSPTTTDKFTVEFQFKTTETAFLHMAVVKGATGNFEWGVNIEDDGITTHFWQASGADHVFPKADTLNNYADGLWHHLAMTYHLNVAVKLYVDGVLLDTETTFIGASTNGTADVTIGAGLPWAAYYSGNLDDLRIWNIVRTQAQIESNIDKVTADEEEGLVAYWNMDEPAGNIFDRSGKGHHSTSITGTLSQNNAPMKRIIGE